MIIINRTILKKSTNSICIIAIFLFFGCRQEITKNSKNEFAGLWALHIMEQKDSTTGEWNEWRKGMQGYILYDDLDNMAVHLTTKGYQNTNLRFPNFIDTVSMDALKHLTGSYVYFAKYRVNEDGTIEHARISHSNPGDWNEIVRRKYTFDGDTLILQPVEASNSRLRLKWIKSR